MKMTLLQMTQDILSDMNSDYANSISDSVESDQVARIIKETYFYLINNVLDLPEHKQIFTLTALGDTDHPTYFLIPDTTRHIEVLRYNKETVADVDLNYKDIVYKSPLDFQKLINTRKESDSNTTAINDFNAGQLLIINDHAPSYWTTFDDKYVVCDSYDIAVDTTLQSSKLFCFGSVEPIWTHSDSFIPLLDADLFPLLFQEAKATCFVDIKQVSNTKAEQRARRQLTNIHNKAHKAPRNRHSEQPDYGRK